MADVNDKIRNPKNPTQRDLKILAWMDEGNTIDSAKAQGLFKTTGLRDAIYRLRCAGNIIHHKDISYKTKDGENKTYRQWFTKGYEIIQAGAKTENELNGSKKQPPKKHTEYNGHNLFNQ